MLLDELYGEGARDELAGLLLFGRVQCQASERPEGGQPEVGRNVVELKLIWPEVGHCDIRIVGGVWVFQHLESQTSGLFRFLCSVLPRWAREHGATRFDAYPGDQTSRAQFTNGGFVEVGGGRIEDVLAESALEDYGRGN